MIEDLRRIADSLERGVVDSFSAQWGVGVRSRVVIEYALDNDTDDQGGEPSEDDEVTRS